MSSPKRKWLTPLLLIIVSTVVAMIMVANRADNPRLEAPDRTVLIDVAEVQLQDLRIPIQAQGSVSPHRETAIVAEVGGKVIEVAPTFYAGGYAAKGDVLLRIDDVEHQANLNRAEAAVATAQSNLAQEQGRTDVAEQEFKKFPKKHRSDAARQLYLRKPQLKQAQAQLLSAKADLRKAQHDMERTVIRAPYDSLIKEKQSDLGLYLSPGTPIARIFAIDFAEVRLAIPQSKLSYLDLPEVGQQEQHSAVKVDLYTSVAGQPEHWSASLHRTEGVYDERSRVLFTVARIDDPYLLKQTADKSSQARPLRIGTFVSAVIEGRLIENLVMLPRNIMRAGDLLWVVDEQNTLRNRKVSTLRTQGTEIYVTSGLQNGDRVSLTPLSGVVAGSKVKIASTITTTELFQTPQTNETNTETPVMEGSLVLPDISAMVNGGARMKHADNQATHKGIIAWFTKNPVAANLLMIVIIVVGIGSGVVIQRAMFPNIEVPVISVSIAYPGAAPEEVELGVILKVEEALKDLEGIERLSAQANESIANIFIEPADGFELSTLMDSIKNRIDGIQHFPEQAEKPIINRWSMKEQALMLQIWGDLDERGMKNLAEEIKRELMAYQEISMVEIRGVREYEIGIEISEQKLREYHLTLGGVADIINASSLNLPGGSVRTENGDIMLRTTGQAYRQYDFEDIVLKTYPDGTRLTLGDIANVNDGFVDENGFALFNGKPSVGLAVIAIGDQDELATAARAKEYAKQKSATLPEGVQLTEWMDMTYYLDERLSMMYKNLIFGAILVFIVLALFLEIKLAFWVMLGIPVCFLGAVAVFNLPIIGGSLNVISLFGFILVLGIVVDDAIIIGESVYSEQEKHGNTIDAVITGAHRVATPATFGVLTTIIAFMPTLFTQGVMAALPAACGWVVILCLVFSLIESKWILPAHLAHSKAVTGGILASIDHIQEAINARLRHFVTHKYLPFVIRCIKNRYTTMAAFCSVLILTIGLVASGIVRYVIFPELPADMIQAELKMADGSSQQQTLDAMTRIDQGLRQVERHYQLETSSEQKVVENTFTFGFERINGLTLGELTKSENRTINSDEVLRRWRDAVGDIRGAEVLSFTAPEGPKISAAISFELIHDDFEVLKIVAAELEAKLATYEGVYDIQNGASATSDEFHLQLLPEAEALGITRFNLGSQVRHAFYGAEAQRIQRGADEIKVMVRYPKQDRHTTGSFDGMFIRTPEGDAIPFDSVARMEVKAGLNKTNHINFQRAVEVEAEANKQLIEPSRVTNEIIADFMPEIQKRYPDLRIRRSGMSNEEAKTGKSMLLGFTLALFGIYALLAVPTKSYLQPLIIMGAIPFGIIGAIIGHLIMGYAFSMMSFFGVIALSGVVVNDSLIMVDFINRSVSEGKSVYQSVLDAGCKRFRAILLTSLTTFFGLLPILLESSMQAQQIVPMAVSLAFGIVFATVITLLLVPCLYMLLDDLANWRTGKSGESLELPTS